MYLHYLIKKAGRIYVPLLWILSLFLFCSTARAQIPGMRKYTQLDGYNATKGYEIEQDEKGYIWLGTDNGGMSFDGKTFRLAQSAPSSPDAEILFCRPLGGGRILLLPLSHRPSYLDKGNLVTADEDAKLSAIKMDYNYCKSDPVTGKWWLSNYGNMDILYSFKGKEVQRYAIMEQFAYVQVINDKFIGQKYIGPGQNYSLCSYDINRRCYQDFYDSAGVKKGNSPEHFAYAGPSPDYLVTIMNNQFKLYRYNFSNSALNWMKDIESPFQIAPGIMYRILLDQEHRFWIKTNEGVFFYSDITDRRQTLSPYYFPELALISSIFVDCNNNIWLTSPNNALYFLSEKHFKNELLVYHFPHRKWIPQAISGDESGKICISYTNHVEVTCVGGDAPKDISLRNSFSEGSRHILPLGNSRFILYDKDIALFDMRKHTVTYFDFNSVYKDISAMGDSALVIAGAAGVYHMNIMAKGKRQPKTLFNKRSTAVEALADKRILIGTPLGLYVKKNLYAPAIKTDHRVLNESNITDILAVNDNSAFIGTNAQGLFMIQEADGQARRIKLSGNNNQGHIRRLYKQNDSTYWVATDNGAYALVFDRNWSVTTTRNYTFYDGLPSNNITDIYVHSDTAYFTTTQGLGIVPLKDGSRLQMAPPGIYINMIQSDDTVFHEPDSMISLTHNQNNILVSLSAISYESLGNTGYYYQLYPLHDKWIQTTNPEIRFTGLPPGKYVFKAYAINAKHIKSKQAVVLVIEIKPAFWQTIYFIIALSVLACILLYTGLRWSMRRGEKKRFKALQQKKRLAELELEAIKAQINPHFIYNCLNSIKYLNYTGAYQQTQEYLSIFAKLIRMTMQYSRKTFITLDQEVDYLSNYLQLEKLRFKDKLQYEINIEDEINREMLLPAMLLQPYVENALKHGVGGQKEHGKVWIAFQKRNDNLEVLIKDNGPGFLDSGTSDALGMHLSATRAVSYNELFSLDIKVQYYNQQDYTPGVTGAVVKITFNTIAYGPIFH